jgi:hypothetical protein
VLEADNQLMQAVGIHQTSSEHQTTQTVQWNISVEVVAYIVLAIVAVLFRVAELDAVPLSDNEARQALHAWHTVNAHVPSEFVISDSPVNYWMQVFAFSTLGASEFTARWGAVLAGVLLSLSPILFRDRIGITRSFVWSVLLSLLTVPIVSSRYADGKTWMMLFAVLTIWMVWRYWYSQKLSDAMWATAFITLMVLLSSPSGIPLLVILLLSGWLAVWRTALSAPERLDLPGDDILQTSLKRLTEFPYMQVAFIPVIVILSVATGSMLNPSGLSTVSQLINTALTGITQPMADDGVRLGFLALLTYEPLLIMFAIGGSWLLWKHGDVTYVDRFAVAWAIVGSVGLLLYAGATASDALWVVVPLTLLASYGITELMVNRLVIVLWMDNENSDGDLYTTQFWWAKWIISLGALLFLMVIAVHFLEVSRGLLTLPPQIGLGEAVTQLFEAQFNEFRYAMLWLVLAIVFCIIGFLLVASFWGNDTTLQGIGLGFVMFMLVSGVGGAWNTAVEQVDSPADLWHQRLTAKDAYLLRDTLFELADRDSQGFPLLGVSVVTDQSGVIANDGLVAWLLRDFPNATFVNSLDAVRGDQIIIMAQTSVTDPDLGGDYVGQSFILRRNWSVMQLYVMDVLAWWTQGRFRTEQQVEEVSILWLRQDVYDGIPITERPR